MLKKRSSLRSRGKEVCQYAELSGVFFARNYSFNLMPARQAFKGADFQTLERIRHPSNQTRIVVALAAANRCNKFLILCK